MEENNKIKEPEKGFNLTLDNFKTQLQIFISESGLPISVVYYILKDLLNEVEKLNINIVEQEYNKFKQESQEYFKQKEELELNKDDGQT